MKTIIAGSRHATYADFISGMNSCPFLDDITEVVSGKADGIDSFGEEFAIANDIHIEPFIAEWNNFDLPIVVRKLNKFGKEYNAAAGTVRNRQMAEYADALILIYDGKSSGSKDMLKITKKHKLKIYVYNYLTNESEVING
jgi:hypothetical protein